MRQRLIATQDDTGLPSAQVPSPCMWDLVEYLSFQRVAVSYQYEASHFTVKFPRMDISMAQQILDGWSRLMAPILQSA